MALGHVVSDNIFFFIFAVRNIYKTKGHNLNKLGKVALGDATTMLYMSYMLKLYFNVIF